MKKDLAALDPPTDKLADLRVRYERASKRMDDVYQKRQTIFTAWKVRAAVSRRRNPVISPFSLRRRMMLFIKLNKNVGAWLTKDARLIKRYLFAQGVARDTRKKTN